MKIDLHVHTACSDGGLTTQQLFDRLKEEGVDLVSITDHDNIDAYETFDKIDRHGIKVLQGIEVDVLFEEKTLHILLYGFDKNSSAMKEYLKMIRKRDLEEFERMISEVKALYNLQIKEKAVKEFEKRNCYFDKVRLNNFLTEQGFSSSPKEAFLSFTRQVKDKTRYSLPADEFFKLAKKSGGISILAHPMKYDEDIEKVKQLILKLKALGLDGVEVRNNRQTLDEEKILCRYAIEEGLLMTAGSDFHCKIGASEKKKLGQALDKPISERDISKIILLLNLID